MFRNCRLARMSDGHYCFMIDLGPVKGGKGMKHHEVIIDFNRRGVVTFVRSMFAKVRSLRPVQTLDVRLGDASRRELIAAMRRVPRSD